ncbi:uncharacterized protein LOC126821455 isoform X2 [Patella vulgata]|uniref:uncharacterized protein LOC126821455 isoform X2 n=1 Tax=Patella vulgata TaxID=6465 RepID=UPI0021801DDA|nr:uncharacterized protein LOC126821455 isoform X2 [Patella vulgata]
MISYEDYIAEQLWYLHKSPRQSLLGIIAQPRDLATERRIMDVPMHLRDFRYHGYPEESFQRPKISNSEEQKTRNRFGGIDYLFKSNAVETKNTTEQNQETNKCNCSDKQRKCNYSDRIGKCNCSDQPRNFNCAEGNERYPPQEETLFGTKIPVVINKDPPAPKVKEHFAEKRQFELEKIKRERREAEEDIKRFKEEQKRKLQEAAEDKKREYERATNYYIWDSRATGHGAPKGDGDNRKQKFIEEETTPKDSFRDQDSSEVKRAFLYTPKVWRPDGFNENIGRHGGSGAPLRTDSGSAQAQVKMHPSIHFQPDKENIPQALNEQLRYNQNSRQRDQYGQDLLKQSQERQLLNQEDRIRELKRELEMLKGGDPYGKPGGGAPLKSKSDSFTERKEHINLDLEQEKYVEPYTPRRRLGLYQDTPEPYFPFGRPGAGAPLVDIEGNVITSLKNKLERNTTSADDRRKARAARVYYQELKQEEAQLIRNRQEMENQSKAPVGDVASLIREGQVGKPRRDPITGTLLNQHLPISDVSHFKMNSQFRDTGEQKSYHEDLTKQADDRHRNRELNRLKDKQLSKQHYDVMDEYWGRCGGGAPKDPVERRKAALDNTLYSPGRMPPRKPEEKILPKYVKNVVNSTHKNHYDYSGDTSSRDHRQGAPYASFR